MERVNILLVEDNEGDLVLTMEALKEARILNRINVARDGEEALKMLAPGNALPDLVLLDINLPKIDGMEVLSTIKSDDRLRQIPVIMLSTSSAESDIARSYANHANHFITKPVDLDRFISVIREIENFWISIVRAPQNN